MSSTSNRKNILQKNYRLTPSNINSLKQIVQAVNQLSEARHINETDVIRGLIVLGSNTSPNKIIESIKQVL